MRFAPSTAAVPPNQSSNAYFSAAELLRAHTDAPACWFDTGRSGRLAARMSVAR